MASCHYRYTLRGARQAFTGELESMRLSRPADFWRLLRPARTPTAAPPAALHGHYRAMLAHLPEGYTTEAWLDLTTLPWHPFTAAEVATAVASLKHNKALGGSWVSPELLQGHSDRSLYRALANLLSAVCQRGVPRVWN